MIRCSRTLCVARLLLGWAAGARAQTPPAPTTTAAEPGAEIRVFVLTFGPGDDPWEKFGHNAIRVIDDGIVGDYHDVAYNWGTFNFDSGFYWKFVQGKLLYAMYPQKSLETIEYYKKDLNRSIYQQELNLTPAQKLRLRNSLAWTDTNANRFYRYDYYRDNCSTRVRDVVDGLAEGRLSAATRSVASDTTYRWHTRRLIGQTPWLYVALQGVLGQPVDRAISQWDEMFLPASLRDRLKELQIPDPAGSGKMMPLVKEEQVLYESTRSPSPTRPPATVPWFLLAGAALSFVYLALGHFVQRKRAARWGLVILAMPWLLLMGLAGPFLVWAWLFTDHVVAAWNENVFHVSPLMLPVIVLLPRLVFGRRRCAEPTRWLMVAAVGSALIGVTLKALPAFYQVNWDIIALTLPVNLSLAFIAWKLADAVKASPKKEPADAKAAQAQVSHKADRIKPERVK